MKQTSMWGIHELTKWDFVSLFGETDAGVLVEVDRKKQQARVALLGRPQITIVSMRLTSVQLFRGKPGLAFFTLKRRLKGEKSHEHVLPGSPGQGELDGGADD